MSRHVRFLTPLAAMLAISASTAAQVAPTAPAAAPQTTRDAVAQARFGELAALQTQTQTARPDAPRVMPVNWVAAREDAQTQLQRGSVNNVAAARQVPQFPRPTNPDAAQVTDTRLPVLIPASPALELAGEPTVLLFPRENFYTLSIAGDGIVIEVFGTRLAHAEAPDPRTARNLRAGGPDGYRFSQTGYGREVSFNRYGAAYSVTVECDDPQTDPRCTGDGYAQRLVDSLLIAAGSPDEGGQ